MNELNFACPSCRVPLTRLSATQRRCPADHTIYECHDGIWRFLTPDRQAYFDRFMHEYQMVRQAEQRGSRDAAYYRALPFVDLSGRFTSDWRIRARSFNTLQRKVLQPLEQAAKRPLRAIDLGAGNGWLSYRLAQRGHKVAAIDLLTNSLDGLGAYVHYDAAFTPVQAEFDRLPFSENQIDLIIFNASLHYSTHYETTLCEALRVLHPQGQLIILDSPVYRSADSGLQMVREREAAFTRAYGFPSNALASENYLTDQRLHDLAETLHLHWKFVRPFYGWRWLWRPLTARLRRRREPARFAVIVGQRWT
ncbi:MAG TPA: class I SAM-dependent methyltransferase [Anaerolineae bacterium]|nr:class I SAM-dependent methyltransferase [Anaerolineae bacterium]